MARCSEENVTEVLNFIFEAPCEDEIVAMDCNDYCEELAQLAEQVAEGAKLEDLLPALKEHMHYWKDCREEFDALVAIIQAEKEESIDELPISEEGAENPPGGES